MLGFTNYHLPPELVGLALGPALRQLCGEPWSKVHRWIENRHVEINGNLCTDRGRKLAAGDVLKLWREPRNAPPRDDQLRIRYVDDHIVVVEKPAGVTSTRHSEERDWSDRRRQTQPTLDEMLTRRLTKDVVRGRLGQRSRVPPVRAVHRLDRDTSGLMVFARSTKAEQRLVEMFRSHTVTRAYVAIVQGRVSAQTIESRLIRDRGDGRRGSTREAGVGKRSVTHVRPLEELGDYTLVECRLETGRTHQIRIHMAEAGHPVCGERVYNRRLFGPELPDRSDAVRQALHAFELALDHPITGERLSFEMPVPADMQRLLDRLRDAAERKR
jgi:23S rRNA pseudouridine1911/1915/1917 synthase